MNRLQKKIITIAMALANISLTTIVATTATFAWFVNNKVVSASGIEMSISADTGVDLRYEVIKYDDYIALGGEAPCREAGKLSIEGKDYIVQDGDIMHFRFNV